MPTGKKPAGKAGKGPAKKPAKSDKTMAVAADKPKSK